MKKTLTLRLDDEIYQVFQAFAKADNRRISNLIEIAARKHLEECLFVDETEMEFIRNDRSLLKKLKKGSRAAKARKGRYTEPL